VSVREVGVDQRMRVLLAVIASIQVVVGLLFLLGVPLATDLWPFPGTNAMSHTFIASFFWAAAVPVAWCLLMRSDRAFTGVFLDYLVIMLPLGLLTLAFGISEASLHLFAFAAFAFVTALFAVWVMRWARRHPWRSDLPTPRPVLAAFFVFCVTLGIVGTLMVIRTPGILPWAITPTLSTVYGTMFLGASAYFAYGLVERRWENAGGQLAGFLAYDIVLIVPFVARIVNSTPSYYGSASEPFRLNLVLYTAVVAGSAIIAVYYLFIAKETRIWPRPPVAALDEAQPEPAPASSA
jgi:hypothetical protein